MTVIKAAKIDMRATIYRNDGYNDMFSIVPFDVGRFVPLMDNLMSRVYHYAFKKELTILEKSAGTLFNEIIPHLDHTFRTCASYTWENPLLCKASMSDYRVIRSGESVFPNREHVDGPWDFDISLEHPGMTKIQTALRDAQLKYGIHCEQNILQMRKDIEDGVAVINKLQERDMCAILGISATTRAFRAYLSREGLLCWKEK